MIETVGSGWMWGGFVVFVLAMLAVDMFALGGKGVHRVSVREALGWSAVWVALALAFNAVLWWYLDQNMGREVANTKALEFLSGYLIEKSLSVGRSAMISSMASSPPLLSSALLNSSKSGECCNLF